MKYKPLYINAIKNITTMEDILSCHKVVILGTGYPGRVVGYMISESIKYGKYDHCPTNICYLELSRPNKQLDGLLFPVTYEIPAGNDNTVLIAADELQTLSRDLIKKISRFRKIIDGTALSNCGYHPVFFSVQTYKKVVSSMDLSQIANELDKQSEELMLPTELASALASRPHDTEVLMNVATYYQKQGRMMISKDYYKRILRIDTGHQRAKLALKWVSDNMKLDEISSLDVIDSMEKALFLNYFGRSGSIYFGSLLDGHDEIIASLPGILYDPFLHLYTLFISQKAEVTLDQLVDSFNLNNQFHGNYDKWIKLKAVDEGKIYDDEYNDRFLSVLKHVVSQELERSNGIISEKFLIKSMYYAHHVASRKEEVPQESIPYILNQFHTPDVLSIKKFVALFPATTILITIRDIIQTMGSLIAAKERENNGKLLPQSVIKLLHYFSENTIMMELSRTNRVVLIPIEKLNVTPLETMRNIAETLYIDWGDSLLVSTILGKNLYDGYFYNGKTYYNHGPRTEGITKRYDEYFTAYDRYRLEVLFFPLLKSWGYCTKEHRDYGDLKDLCVLPFKFEKNLEMAEEEVSSFRKQFTKAYLEVFAKLEQASEYLERLELI